MELTAHKYDFGLGRREQDAFSRPCYLSHAVPLPPGVWYADDGFDNQIKRNQRAEIKSGRNDKNAVTVHQAWAGREAGWRRGDEELKKVVPIQ